MEIHVIPYGELNIHLQSSKCRCKPRIKPLELYSIIRYNKLGILKQLQLWQEAR